MLKLKLLILWPPDSKNWLLRKDPDAGKGWRREEKETTEDEMVGWTWVWASSGSWWWTGKPGVLQSMGSQTVGQYWTECSIQGARNNWGLWHPTPVLLPGKSHGWRSLVGCSPWGREESDTTEWLHFDFSLSCIAEGNGNPLQCSCLENPRDGGAW